MLLRWNWRKEEGNKPLDGANIGFRRLQCVQLHTGRIGGRFHHVVEVDETTCKMMSYVVKTHEETGYHNMTIHFLPTFDIRMHE